MSDLRAIQNELAAWAATALHPNANHLKKLQEEFEELQSTPDDASEMADVFLALIIHASSTKTDLMAAIHKYRLQAGLEVWASKVLHPIDGNLNRLQEALHRLNIIPSDPERIIGVLVALVAHSSSKRIDLFAAARRKFEIVKLRTYGNPDANGVCRHIACGAEPHIAVADWARAA